MGFGLSKYDQTSLTTCEYYENIWNTCFRTAISEPAGYIKPTGERATSDATRSHRLKNENKSKIEIFKFQGTQDATYMRKEEGFVLELFSLSQE